MVEALKSTDLTKGNSVFSCGNLSGGSYKNEKGSMSIFDNVDFQRLPDKTEGEKLAEENAKKRSFKDDSWRNNSKSSSYGESFSKFFDNLVEGE